MIDDNPAIDTAVIWKRRRAIQRDKQSIIDQKRPIMPDIGRHWKYLSMRANQSVLGIRSRRRSVLKFARSGLAEPNESMRSSA